MEQDDSSVEKVMTDEFLVSPILRRLTSVSDRDSASLVCKLWNDGVTHETQTLTVRSRSLLPLLLPRFSHVKILDFRPCSDQLHDEDLLTSASTFPHLHTLIVGNPVLLQKMLMDDGLSGFVKNSPRLHHVTLCSIHNLHDAGVRALTQHCRDLTTLSLSNCKKMMDNALDALSNCKSLKTLTLKGDFSFTPYELSRVGENCRDLVTVCFELESVDISLALRSLAINCQKLETLTLKYRQGDLGGLSECGSLVRLHIEVLYRRPFLLFPMPRRRNDVDIAIMNIAAANRKLKQFSYVNIKAPLGASVVMHPQRD